ncbi:hypothetical protein O181_012975 [Austropuccinia psidii MF-1]|uniref:Reverse transcriptase/retrotransposon-derived protein RNase H-like domain-containing protein n=1 Tax=Austropuccinia psidii MF-1 TaxID=1389203 RepID=A0A9Q3GNG4_9BASI|nr:hypothetical protein [Austropuccinia psidii MF-1]
MKAPDSFDGTQAHKLRGFIQSCQLTFHNYPVKFFSDKKKIIYSTSFLTGRAGKWIEPYLSNISNEGPSYLPNNGQLFETQLFTLFGDPNEVRKAKQELDNLRMKESGHVYFYEGDFFIIDSPKGEDLILGYDFLYHFKPIIDWKNGLITYDYSGSNSSSGNDYATAAKSVALFFKEIKDLGEDDAISSLHLFQGDMNLNPLSFHTSLEEQWDDKEEPEKIEAVLKPVPPAYHQYLDVLSKVKLEKLPPHHACDHHIKLEGLLPPEALIQFQTLKEEITTACIISHLNPSLPSIVKTNASDYSLGSLPSQVNDSGKHPIGFYSLKLLLAELNYEIHEKELLGIVWALKCW